MTRNMMMFTIVPRVRVFVGVIVILRMGMMVMLCSGMGFIVIVRD